MNFISSRGPFTSLLVACALLLFACSKGKASSESPQQAAPFPELLATRQTAFPGTPPATIAMTAAPVLTATVVAYTLQGSISIFGLPGVRGPWTPIDFPKSQGCKGSGGYSDISEGTQVVVKNGQGTILATGRLGVGTFPPIPSPAPKTPPTTDICGFAFLVPAIPDSDFYSIEVSHRGALVYSREDLKAKGWQVALSLGGN